MARVLRQDAAATNGGRQRAGRPLRLVRPDDRTLLRVCGGRQGGRPARGRHPLRVHAARTDHGGRRRAGLPLRRLGPNHSGRRAAFARQSLPADQVHLRLSRPGQQSVSGNGRSGGGRDHLRRQAEDVRADGRVAADVRARPAAQGRRRRCLGILGAGVGGVPGVLVSQRFAEDVARRRKSARRSGW